MVLMTVASPRAGDQRAGFVHFGHRGRGARRRAVQGRRLSGSDGEHQGDRF